MITGHQTELTYMQPVGAHAHKLNKHDQNSSKASVGAPAAKFDQCIRTATKLNVHAATVAVMRL